MIPLPHNILLSYFYFRNIDFSLLEGFTLIADCGAFSADRLGKPVVLSDYVSWLRDWQGWFTWAASLDVIGDTEATRRNWLAARDTHGLDLVPTIHYPEKPTAMDFYAKRGVRFMGLGGLVGVRERPRGAWLAGVFKYQRERWPGVEFHGWGVTQWPLLRFPFKSVDSSTWNAGTKFGDLTVRDPGSLRDYSVDVSRGGKPPSMAARRLLASDHYGSCWEEIRNSRGENRTEILLVSARSAKVLEDRFNAIHAGGWFKEPLPGGRMPGQSSPARGRLHLAAGGDLGTPPQGGRQSFIVGSVLKDFQRLRDGPLARGETWPPPDK